MVNKKKFISLLKRFDRVFLAVISIALLLIIFCIKLTPIALKTFPLENAEAVIYTLTQNVMGAKDYAIELFKEKILDAVREYFLIYVATVIASFLLYKLLRKYTQKIKQLCICETILFVVFLVDSFIFISQIVVDLPVKQYVLLYRGALAEPKHSILYQQEYVFPDSLQIIFPPQKKNLLLIMLESMEFGYQDYAHRGNLSENLIPEISKMIEENEAFVPGGSWVHGTGWTMADIVAKTCGLPLKLPVGGNSYGVRSFLPNAKCLTDVLLENGYLISVSQGAEMNFASMKYFLETHGNPKKFDLLYYKHEGLVNWDELTIWGVPDKNHYELSKKNITTLSNNKSPWAYWMFTIETHAPFGVLDKSCEAPQNIQDSLRYPFVIRCASLQLSQFVKWAETQDWYENTVIAIMGDHKSHALYHSVGYDSPRDPRRWLNVFINSNKHTSLRERTYTSFDMYPTILESMGVSIPGHALGLGKSLFSNELTLAEKYGLDCLNQKLKPRSYEYDYFLYSK